MNQPLKSRSRRSHHFLVAVALVALSGCADLKPNVQNQEEKEEQVIGVDIHSAFPAIRRVAFEQVNLLELVDPSQKAQKQYPKAWSEAETRNSFGLKYDLALAAFREDAKASDADKRAHRNSVQDRILGVSTSRCNVFKTFLRRRQSTANFWLGSLTTASGVLGAILPGVRATQNLAGAAGLFSGIQAEYNSDFFSNTAAALIAKGIDAHQKRLYAQLMEARKGLDVNAYSMEAAIRAAIYFDGTCSAVVGLQEANMSLEEQQNPGIPRAAQVIAAVRAMNEIANAANFTELSKSGQLGRLIKVTQVDRGDFAAGLGGEDSNPAEAVRARAKEAARAAQGLKVYVAQKGEGLVVAFEKAQAKRKWNDPETPQAVANDANKNFVKRMPENLEANKNFGLDACVASLKEPTEALYDKLGKQAQEAEGTAPRMEADAALAVAVVQMESALAALDWHSAESREYVGEQAKQWEDMLTKIPVDESAVKKLEVRTRVPPASRCGRGAAVAAPGAAQ